jgi:CRISPR system Cascade subunit CasB
MIATAESIPPSQEQRARDWWKITLSGEDGDRGVRAQLRRCHTPLDAAIFPAALSLARRLGRIPGTGAPEWKQKGFERALGLAIALAHVRTEASTPLLRVLGWGQFPYDKKESDVVDGRPVLSELRFKRFLQTDGEDELIAAFSRLIQLVKGETNVADLARVFLRWDDDRTKRDLALTYFRANAGNLSESSP